MTEVAEKLKSMLRLQNQKGQGLVEFAIILAFCTLIGYFAQTSGFLDALNDSYNKSADSAFASPDIVAGQTKVSGTVAAKESTTTGGGTSQQTTTDPATTDPTTTDPATTDPTTTDPTTTDPTTTDPTTTDPTTTDPTTTDPSTPVVGPVINQTGENLSPLAYYEKLKKYHDLYSTVQAVDKNDIVWNAYAESDYAILNIDRNTLFSIFNEWPTKIPGNDVRWADLYWGGNVLNTQLDQGNAWMNMIKPKCENSNLSPKQVWEKLNVYHEMLSTVQSKTVDELVWEEYLNNDYSVMKLEQNDYNQYVRYNLPTQPDANFKWEDINDQSPWQWINLKNIYYNSNN